MALRASVLGIMLAFCRCASALNPSLDINQYAHSAWTARDGFFKGTMTSIAQTPDGYLWVGTEFGLLRFDGVRSVSWQPPAGQHLPSNSIRSLLAARDGRLWIGTAEGLASWKDLKLTHYAELAGQDVFPLLEDRDGTLWAAGRTPAGTLCAIQTGSVHCYRNEGSFDRGAATLYEDSGGNLWAAAETRLWRWKPGPPKVYPMPSPGVTHSQALSEDNNGPLLIATQSGIKRFVDGNPVAYPIPGGERQFRPHALLRDRDGGLWIGTYDRGLLHVHQDRTDLFTRSDGLSGDYIQALFEDREGSIWVATSGGLDRFRDLAVATISVKQGLSSSVGSVLAARDGSVWLGTGHGLNRWHNGKITIYQKGSGLLDDAVQSLFQDDRGRIWISTAGGVAYLENERFIAVGAVRGGPYVHSIAGDSAGNVWISDDQSLFRSLGTSAVARITWAELGHKDLAIILVPDALRGGLWLGFSRGGVAYFKDGKISASYSVRDGLGEGRVAGLELDGDGTIWAATGGGLSRIKNGRVATLTSKNGLPCDAVHWAMEDDAHSVWLYMGCGLVRVPRTELDAWTADSKRTIQAALFDSFDGVISHSSPVSGYGPRVARSTDGKLWFLAGEGVSVIDPRHLPLNNTPPPVHIEQITADRKIRWQNLWGAAASNLRLPALSRDLQIDYTALSLVAPEKVRFRYKLEGEDKNWQDAGNRRQAFYTNLGPKSYRFRVMAANNSGVWNETGATLDFAIDPAFYQTTWFRASGAAVILAMLACAYQLRLRYVKRQFAMRTEERVNERTRIARDLHDTLLQSLAGVSLQLDGISKQAATHPERTPPLIARVREQVDYAFREARVKVWNLRSPTLEGRPLATALGEFVERTAPASKARCGLTVSGQPRPCTPEVEEELLRIAQEATNNAIQHAEANEIRIALEYSARSVTLSISDDGRGFDWEEGYRKSGHWGLKNMGERAALVRGTCKTTTAPGQGTRVEVSVPLSSWFSRNTLAKHANSNGS